VNAVLIALTFLLSGAVASIVLAGRRPAAIFTAILASALACLACVYAAISTLTGGPVVASQAHWPLPLGEFSLALDGLSAWFLLIIGLVGFASAVYSWGYFDGGKSKHAHRAYAPLFCLLLAALVLTVCADDAVVFLLGWEFTSLSAFFLVGLADEDPKARFGAWTYLIATHVGTALGVLPLFAAFIARTGGTSMDQFAGAFSSAGPAACVVIFALATLGFGMKAGLVPFHVWLPLAHPVAPSPVSALMSGVVVKIGIYGLIRTITWLPDLPPYCGAALLFLALGSSLFGIISALGQGNLKAMLAYSTVENVGIVAIGIAVAMIGRSFDNPLLVACGMGGALLHALNHALFKGLLFLSAGTVLHGAGTGDLERLGGLASQARFNSLAFLTGSIAICALPPLNGFLSEFLIYYGLLHGVVQLPMAYGLLAGAAVAFLALSGAIALVVFSKAFSVVFLGQPRDPGLRVHKTPLSMNIGMAILGVACVAVVPMWGSVAHGLGRVVDADFVSVSEFFRDTTMRMTFLWYPLGVFLIVAALLWGLRRVMSKGRLDSTWGCGYARPGPTMQYTGSSYGWNLLTAFRQIARSERLELRGLSEHFPRPSVMETTHGDLALDRVYRPLFIWASRLCERFWPLQQGRIQLYLVYMVGTLIVLFLIEAWFMPYRAGVLMPGAGGSP
jgi:hydrogenase-4 component B